MKTFSKFLLIVALFLPSNNAHSQQRNKKDTRHSIALVLKVSGEKNIVATVESYHHSFFYGRIKNQFLQRSVSRPDYLNIKVEGENGELFFDGYTDNPLSQELEAFNPDGNMEKVDSGSKEDYINIRFHIPENVRRINVKCYQNSNKEMKMISTFKMDIK